VASDLPNLYRLESVLKDVAVTLGIEQATKWCVLAHIDDQIKLHKAHPGIVDAAFQSIGGNEEINKVFNLTTKKLRQHYGVWDSSPDKTAALQSKRAKANADGEVVMKEGGERYEAPPAMYFETGQGSALTNGVAYGVDMVTLEARAHGLARAIGKKNGKWMIGETRLYSSPRRCKLNVHLHSE
jgi:ethanolamine ammonia-lyase large subunit